MLGQGRVGRVGWTRPRLAPSHWRAPGRPSDTFDRACDARDNLRARDTGNDREIVNGQLVNGLTSRLVGSIRECQ